MIFVPHKQPKCDILGLCDRKAMDALLSNQELKSSVKYFLEFSCFAESRGDSSHLV